MVSVVGKCRTMIGFLLTQSRPNKEDGIVACGGRSLRGAEYNYTVTELEMLSVGNVECDCRQSGGRYDVIV